MIPKPSVERFADPTFLILASLMEGPKHGYAMMEDIKAFSGMLLEPGTLYGAISRLESHGLIRACHTEERRQPYEITAEGIRVFEERVRLFENLARVGTARFRAQEQ